jgi:hypothetical protein
MLQNGFRGESENQQIQPHAKSMRSDENFMQRGTDEAHKRLLRFVSLAMTDLSTIVDWLKLK